MNRSTTFTSGPGLLRAELNAKSVCAIPKLNIQVARIYENRIDWRLKKSESTEREKMDCDDSAEVSMENFVKLRALVIPLNVCIQVLAHPDAVGARDLKEGSLYEFTNYQLLGRDELSPDEMVYVAQNTAQFRPVETMIGQSSVNDLQRKITTFANLKQNWNNCSGCYLFNQLDLVERVSQSRCTPDSGLECVTLVDLFGDELEIRFKDNGKVVYLHMFDIISSHSKTRDVVLSNESVLGFKDLYLKRNQYDQGWQVVFGSSSSMLIDLSSAPHLIEEFERISSTLIDWDMSDSPEPAAPSPSQLGVKRKRELASDDHLQLKKFRL